MADGYLSSYGLPDSGAFQRSQDALTSTYNTNQATNAYGRFLSQMRGERSLGEMGQTFTRDLPNAYASFNKRGLGGPGITSGTQQRGMQNYVGDYQRNYVNAQADLASSLQQYDLQGLQNTDSYQTQLADLETQKQQEIANAALGIQALRPYFGSST
jgi:hypothetical protein